jgi:hypothetical protein
VPLWPWKKREPEERRDPEPAKPPRPPKWPKSGDELRQAFLERLEARADDEKHA